MKLPRTLLLCASLPLAAAVSAPLRADSGLPSVFAAARSGEVPAVEGRAVEIDPAVAKAASAVGKIPSGERGGAEALTVKILTYMARSIRWHGDAGRPVPRDPHEWSGSRVIAAGSFNGCVEAAKAFKSLYDASNPSDPARFVGGTLKGEDGGHAVVEVTGSDGKPFLVDTAMFPMLSPSLDPRLTVRPEGMTIQTGKEDVNVKLIDGRFVLTRYQYRHLFQEDRKIGSTLHFPDPGAVNAWLRENASPARSFEALKRLGIVQYERNGSFSGLNGKTLFVYQKTAGEPFSGTDAQRRANGQRALEDAVKNAPGLR